VRLILGRVRSLQIEPTAQNLVPNIRQPLLLNVSELASA